MLNWSSQYIKDEFEYQAIEFPSLKYLGTLDNIVGSTINNNMLTTLKSTATINYFGDLNMPKNMVRIVYRATDTISGEYTEEVLGTFFVSTPSKTVSGVNSGGSASCYSILKAASDACVKHTFTAESGSNPVLVAVELMESCGIKSYYTDTSHILASSMTWDPFTPILTICNDLMNAAGYASVGVDGYGHAIMRENYENSSYNVEYEFSDDDNCVFNPEMGYTMDTFATANVVNISYSDGDNYYSATARNDDPNSAYSTVSRGREITKNEELYSMSVPDNFTEEQKSEYINNELSKRANKALKDGMSVVESYTIFHTYVPYNLGDTVRVNYKAAGVDSVMSVVSFDINASVPCTKNARVRRFVRG